MRKIIGLFVFGIFFLIALASFSSAYYYGGYYDPYYGGIYDSQYSYNVKTSGSYYGPRTTTATKYDKVSVKYWNGRSWVDRTTYVKEKVETPHGYGYHPRYSNYRYYGGYYDYDYGRQRYGNYVDCISYYDCPKASYLDSYWY